MGQSPSKPSESTAIKDLGTSSVYQQLPALTYQPLKLDISDLPDISPFPRRPDLRTAANQSRSDFAPVRQKSTRGRMSTRKRKSHVLGKKTALPVRKATVKGESAARAKTLSSPDNIVNKLLPAHSNTSVFGQTTPPAGTPLNAPAAAFMGTVPIPRIDVIESLPLLAHASQQLPTPPAPSVLELREQANAPDTPAIHNSHPGLTAEGGGPGRRISAGSFVGLPLPGTPAVEDISFEQAILRGLEKVEAEPRLTTKMQRSTSHESTFSSQASAETAVTKEIRILRVVNAESGSSPTSSEDEAGVVRPFRLSAGPAVNNPPPVSLAVKRNVATPPAPIKVHFPPVQSNGSARLSPITPTSASSSRISGSAQSGVSHSTAATSMPQSPTPMSKKNTATQAELGVSSTRPPILPDPFEGMDAFAAAFGITGHSALYTSNMAACGAAHAAKRESRSLALGVSTKAPAKAESRRASYHSGGNRTRSASHSSSDGDRSGAYSSTSALTGSSGKAGIEAATKNKQLKKKRRSSHTADRRGSAVPRMAFGAGEMGIGVSPGCLPKDMRQVSAPPALISLNFEKREVITAGALLGAPERCAPPRSPRPPATPVLGSDAGNKQEERLLLSFEKADEILILPPPEIFLHVQETEKGINASPAFLPDIQQSKGTDWDMTDFLLRCGITPSPTDSTHKRNCDGVAHSPHPPALRPRTSLADMASPDTPAPWLVTPAGSPPPISPLPMYRHTPLSSASPSPTRPAALQGNQSLLMPPLPEFIASGLTSARHSHRHDQSLAIPAYKPALPPRPDQRSKHETGPITRYAAFQLLAQQAVDEPYNPFLDSNGAVRLGEYKRGQNEGEIFKWLKGINKVKREGRMLSKNEK